MTTKSAVEIVNSTVYDSDDVAKIVRYFYPNLEKLKIRYLNAPTWRGKNIQLIHSGYQVHDKLEVAILRYSKLPINPLKQLALATVTEKRFSPSSLVSDLTEVLKDRLSWSQLQDFTDPKSAFTIRVHDKAKGRKLATLNSHREKVTKRKESIAHRENLIASALRDIEWWEREIKDGKVKLAEEEQKLADYEKQMKKGKL